MEQKKIKCSNCGISLVHVYITKLTEDVSKIQAKCWKCNDSSFIVSISGKYNIIDTTKSKIESVSMSDNLTVITTSKKER